MDKEAVKLYKLNERALQFRNSKEFFIGQRIRIYIGLIKQFRFIKMFEQIFEDVYRVIFKKKKNPEVETLDFNKEYTGKRIVVYTSVFGNYDTIAEPLYCDPNCDYYIITDQEVPGNSIWKKYEKVNFPEGVNTPFLKNR